MNTIKILIAIVFCTLTSCVSLSTDNKQTLYQELGGETGIENIVDDLINEIGNDQQIFHYFAKADITHFRQGLIEHFCAISNGPCEYTGDNMIDIHTGMNVKETDFNHLVDLLINAMDQNNVPHSVQNQLLAKLVPLRKDIIYR
ncbi:group I truncated hemoglobin [Pleionea mediterranea]|uniref:Group 1 truncated hemoglobin n=1 Tax=Pleionea mediterranea TaxID=523701 RepID=A0A316FFI5_9GAMM|nr:group 1 truncated hemoglobin [Pleionea mediterranea]PWK46835.1 hemoglobin [Pleionea mediterranea]